MASIQGQDPPRPSHLPHRFWHPHFRHQTHPAQSAPLQPPQDTVLTRKVQ